MARFQQPLRFLRRIRFSGLYDMDRVLLHQDKRLGAHVGCQETGLAGEINYKWTLQRDLSKEVFVATCSVHLSCSACHLNWPQACFGKGSGLGIHGSVHIQNIS